MGLYDRFMDFCFGVKTCGLVSVEKMDLTDEQKKTSYRYEPAPYLLLSTLFKELDKNDLSQWSLVDYGCGKGRVLKYAQSLYFRRIIGVEIDKNLFEVAQKNVGNFAELHHTSAEAPLNIDGPTIHMFFNPFHWDILKTVVMNIKKYQRTGHEQKVILVNPAFIDQVKDFGFSEIKRMKTPYSAFEISFLEPTSASS